jgi:hypothetical protein
LKKETEYIGKKTAKSTLAREVTEGKCSGFDPTSGDGTRNMMGMLS